MSFEERKLTNDDFRKLFMTPRHPGDSSSSSSFAQPPPPTPSFATPTGSKDPGSVRKHHDKAKEEKRRQKKHFYAKIKKEEDDQMAELARKYRDRAKERRDGGNPEQQSDDLITSQGAYRAVAPDFRGNVDAAERRKQMIQESKFLGGDMEHTHLVKGLDYALLQKVRSELEAIGEDRDIDEILEKEEQKEVAPEPNAEFRSRLSRNIFRVVFKSAAPERNELFAPNRMAYVMDLEDEYAESDIPTTLIRSKADVPNAQGQATLTTNDIVINKLAQILSYLRQGSKASKKQRKKETKTKVEVPEVPRKKVIEEDSIYGEIGDYVPTVSKSKSRGHDSKESRSRESSRREKSKSKYFEKPIEDDEVVLDKRSDKKHGNDPWNESDGKGDQTFGSILKRDEKSLSRAQKLLSKINAQPEGYAECYPGFDEMHDAIEDSDDEIDYSKMDPGKKKGTVGRWDFDSMEEYSDYMSNKEALPKAAFQFGVKMNDGRKTRKGGKNEKNEKAQLDRQWQQIQAIMQKRKGGGGGEGEPESKTPKV